MTPALDRADIQGNVLQPFGRKTFPMGHLLLFHVERSVGDRSPRPEPQARDPRCFVESLLAQVSSGRLYRSKRTRRWFPSGGTDLPLPPPVGINVAFTCAGLAALGVPPTTLAGFPEEFQQGMRQRAAVLNDDPSRWDPVWREEAQQDQIHVLVVLRVNIATLLRRTYAREEPHPEAGRHADHSPAGYHRPEILAKARGAAIRRLNLRSQSLITLAGRHGLRLLSGHGCDQQPDAERRWQVMESLLRTREEDGFPTEDGERIQGVAAPAGPIAPQRHPQDQRYGEYEHFGFFDGIADPVFAGQVPAEDQGEELIGQGRRSEGAWHPLATGEFLLGYPDEAQETPAAALPFSFSRNGTFLVVRKLHQHVAAFERAIADQLPAFEDWLQERDPEARPLPGSDGDQGREAAAALLRAKLVGRWTDGTPLVVAPTYRSWREFQRRHHDLIHAADRERQAGDGRTAQDALRHFRRQFRDITYEPADHDGGRCPFTSHIRRSNPRDSGDPNLGEDPGLAERQRARSVLVNRRRLLRRGMTYGQPWRPQLGKADAADTCVDDGQERGTLFMALCTGVFRQFEFVQQQWLNYGTEFGAGNDVCPISGVMAQGASHRSKLMIGAPQNGGRPPFVMRPAAAVECRGGGYFFVPSLTALRQIAQGLVDPI